MTLAYFNNLAADLEADHGPYGVRAILLIARITNRLGCDREGWTARSRRDAELSETSARLADLVSGDERDCAA